MSTYCHYPYMTLLTMIYDMIHPFYSVLIHIHVCAGDQCLFIKRAVPSPCSGQFTSLAYASARHTCLADGNIYMAKMSGCHKGVGAASTLHCRHSSASRTREESSALHYTIWTSTLIIAHFSIDDYRILHPKHKQKDSSQ